MNDERYLIRLFQDGGASTQSVVSWADCMLVLQEAACEGLPGFSVEVRDGDTGDVVAFYMPPAAESETGWWFKHDFPGRLAMFGVERFHRLFQRDSWTADIWSTDDSPHLFATDEEAEADRSGDPCLDRFEVSAENAEDFADTLHELAKGYPSAERFWEAARICNLVDSHGSIRVGALVMRHVSFCDCSECLKRYGRSVWFGSVRDLRTGQIVQFYTEV